MHHLVGTWGYLGLICLAVISSAGVPIGAEFAIGFAGAVAGGALASSHHLHLNLLLVICCATAGEVTGSLIGYCIGRYGGRNFVAHFGRFLLLTERDLNRAEAYFERRGSTIVLFGRLVPLVRSFVSFGPGLARMSIRRFTVLTTIGCATWCAALSSIGYLLGKHWHRWFNDLGTVGYVTLGIGVAVLLVSVSLRISTLRRERELGRVVT